MESLMQLQILAILPEILLLVLMGVILTVDLVLREEKRDVLAWVNALGLGIILLLSIWVARPPSQPLLLWGGMVTFDWLSFSFKSIFLFGAAITSLFAMWLPRVGRRGEFYILLLVSTMGMCFMASAGDLIMLYLAIETTSIPLYVLAGFLTKDDKSTEAGFKYLLFGAMTSAVLLYGFSLLYGFTGTTNIFMLADRIRSLLSSGGISVAVIIGTLLLVLVGFGFKISIVPLHFWAPDVYEGAPTPVTGFLSTASKAAGFAVLVRFLIAVFPIIVAYWVPVLAALSVATMTLGNLLALTQKNIKRMLAYSSIAHAGYILIGLASVSQLGLTSVVFYLAVYLVTNLAAFGVIVTFGRVVDSDDMTAYYGLSRRSPGLALALMVALLSLAGMPPLGGFIVKFFVFAAAVKSNLIWLAVIGVLNSIIGLYYYLTVLKYVYLYRSEDDEKPVPVPRAYALALGILSVMIIALGTLFAPWVAWAANAARTMF